MTKLNIGKNIRHLRELNGFSQTYLAELICVSQKTLSRIETGFKSPTIEILQRICVELKIDLVELIDFQNKFDFSSNYCLSGQEKSNDLKSEINYIELKENVIYNFEFRISCLEKYLNLK